MRSLTALLAIVLCLGASCVSLRPAVALTSESLPPSFEFTGVGYRLQWIWFQGPYFADSERSASQAPARPEDVVIWKIRPATEISVSEIPRITYGQLPTGWAKEVPSGTPPVLVEGGIYYVAGVLDRGVVEMCFLSEHNKAVSRPCADR